MQHFFREGFGRFTGDGSRGTGDGSDQKTGEGLLQLAAGVGFVEHFVPDVIVGGVGEVPAPCAGDEKDFHHVAGAELTGKGHAVLAVFLAEIEDGKTGQVAGTEEEGLCCAVGMQDPVAFCFQRVFQVAGNDGLVFHQQYLGRVHGGKTVVFGGKGHGIFREGRDFLREGGTGAGLLSSRF